MLDEPLRDAKAGVAALGHLGFVFDVITSCGVNFGVPKARETNIGKHFNNEHINSITCLEIDSSKTPSLTKYKGSGNWWIDDLPEHCEAGLALGLRPIIVDHHYNQWYSNPDVLRVSNWEEICQVITND